ncbi:MAG TPA: hypothetical protein VLF17_03825 [Candidatus Nitrosotenuis sp.]|nr:hypothetical protein [Candidatus Nitrosotenuis sp.]
MVKRITIMLDDDLDRKMRLKQARQIEKTGASVSFSRVINDTIRDGLKNGK